ncbi:hypothetical protein O181_035988 [Austropuccinia psidii MF-1]|uniref:Uncharacterized protein n=1 Tax=Austropuccinia psidii MF-1 TaxID=1389203 RepID=A0A9Q3D8L3_9BASI|nr:hypothetical protein [Austropuccinia psidii MF-1]
MKIQVLWGLNNYSGPPLQLWGGQFLDCPGSSNWAQAIWWKIGPMDPLEPQHIWAQVASNSPHTVGHLIHKKDPKRPEMALNQGASRLARTQNGPEDIFGPFFKGNGDKTPPFRLQNFQSRQEGTQGMKLAKFQWVYVHILIGHHFLSRRDLWNSFWDTTQGHEMKRRY